MDELPMWHKLFTYDPATGVLRWKITPGRRVKCGDIAGRKSGDGYLQVGYGYKTRAVHRIIYEMNHGSIPQGKQIDHKNRIKTDNRIANLRLATGSENQRNSTIQSNNTSGFVGVSWHKTKGKWQVNLSVANRWIFCGRFASKSEAIAVRLAAEKRHYGEFAQSLVTEGVSNAG